MNIGISGYIGERKTGIGRTLENILIGVARQRPADMFTMFVNFDQADLIDVRWPANVRLVPYRVSRRSPILNILWHQIFFQYSLRKHDCELSLIPNFSLLLWKVCPTIVFIYDLIEFHVENKFSRIRMFYRHLAVPLMARRSDAILTISKSSKRDIVEILKAPASKVDVAYCGYDPARFLPHPSEAVRKVLAKYSVEPGSYILSIGTVDFPGKNVFTLIKAYFRLRERGSAACRLVVIGKPGHNYGVIEELIRNSPYGTDVLLLGYVDDNDLPYFYGGALLFGFLSLYEGFGLPVLEAMASGCPVLASNASSIPEIVGSAGILVDPMDLDQVSSAMQNLLASGELRTAYSRAGLEQARKFTWDGAAAVLAKTLSEMSNNQKGMKA